MGKKRKEREGSTFNVRKIDEGKIQKKRGRKKEKERETKCNEGSRRVRVMEKHCMIRVDKREKEGLRVGAVAFCSIVSSTATHRILEQVGNAFCIQ